MKSVSLLLLLYAMAATAFAIDLASVYTKEQLLEIDESILEDAKLNFTQLVTKYKYPVEVHNVTTKDGYVLTLQRIPYGRACGQSSKPKVPVLLQHGLFCSADDYIIMGPGKGLGYILADECYDVWFGNSRGSKHSRKHISLTVNNPKFWEFSWHEMGVSDLPPVIDYILDQTKQPSLHYIGHSQGTTQFFIFASKYPQYHEKIRSAHALSPVAYMKNLKSPALRILSIFHKPIHALAGLVGIHEFMPTCEFLNLIGMELCRDKYPALQAICTNVLFLITGSNPELLNTTMLPAIIGHTPAGASTRQLVHYAQGILNDGFRAYDHGGIINLLLYGSIAPPSYDVTKVHVPIAFYYSDGDWLADVDDVHRFIDLFPNTIGRYRIHHKLFSHIDYLWGLNVKPLVYDTVLSLMKRY